MMRFAAMVYLLCLIQSEGQAQLLPATVKKPVTAKPSAAKKATKPAAETVKEPVTPPSAPAEEKKEVKPIVVEEKKSTLKIISDNDATLYVDGEKIGALTKDIAFKVPLSKGVYNIKVVSLKFPVTENKETYRVEGNGMDDIWNIALKIKEIHYWTNEVMNTIKPYLQKTYIDSYKIMGKISSSIGQETIELTEKHINSKIITTTYNSKNIVIGDATVTKNINILDISGFSFKTSRDVLNDPKLWLKLNGNAIAEVYDNKNNSIITPKTESEFTIRIVATEQSELEPKLIALFMQKPF